MSKYDPLWKYIKQSGKQKLKLSFDEIGKIAGIPLDHSFLKYKKELKDYGYETVKISMKEKTALFAKTEN